MLLAQCPRCSLPAIHPTRCLYFSSRFTFPFSLDLRSFHLPYSRISLVPNVGLQVAISNAFAEVDGNWRVKFHFMWVPFPWLRPPSLCLFLSGSGQVSPFSFAFVFWAALASLPPDLLIPTAVLQLR